MSFFSFFHFKTTMRKFKEHIRIQEAEIQSPSEANYNFLAWMFILLYLYDIAQIHLSRPSQENQALNPRLHQSNKYTTTL